MYKFWPFFPRKIYLCSIWLLWRGGCMQLFRRVFHYQLPISWASYSTQPKKLIQPSGTSITNLEIFPWGLEFDLFFTNFHLSVLWLNCKFLIVQGEKRFTWDLLQDVTSSRILKTWNKDFNHRNQLDSGKKLVKKMEVIQTEQYKCNMAKRGK